MAWTTPHVSLTVEETQFSEALREALDHLVTHGAQANVSLVSLGEKVKELAIMATMQLQQPPSPIPAFVCDELSFTATVDSFMTIMATARLGPGSPNPDYIAGPTIPPRVRLYPVTLDGPSHLCNVSSFAISTQTSVLDVSTYGSPNTYISGIARTTLSVSGTLVQEFAWLESGTVHHSVVNAISVPPTAAFPFDDYTPPPIKNYKKAPRAPVTIPVPVEPGERVIKFHEDDDDA